MSDHLKLSPQSACSRHSRDVLIFCMLFFISEDLHATLLVFSAEVRQSSWMIDTRRSAPPSSTFIHIPTAHRGPAIIGRGLLHYHFLTTLPLLHDKVFEIVFLGSPNHQFLTLTCARSISNREKILGGESVTSWSSSDLDFFPFSWYFSILNFWNWQTNPSLRRDPFRKKANKRAAAYACFSWPTASTFVALR